MPTIIRKGIQHHPSMEKCQLKPQGNITWPLLGWLLPRRQEITNGGEAMEKSEPLCTLGSKVNCCSHYGKTIRRFFKKLEVELYIQQSFFWAKVNKIITLKRHLYSHVHSHIMYNSPGMKAAQVSVSGSMDEEKVAYIHN